MFSLSHNSSGAQVPALRIFPLYRIAAPARAMPSEQLAAFRKLPHERPAVERRQRPGLGAVTTAASGPSALSALWLRNPLAGAVLPHLGGNHLVVQEVDSDAGMPATANGGLGDYFTPQQAPTERIVALGHQRWDIENFGFSELLNGWEADHIYKHDGGAIEAFLLMAFLAYNIFHAFIGLTSSPYYATASRRNTGLV